MAELDAQLRLDIDQALRDINQIEAALDRAIAPIEIEVDDRQALELESTLREVERIASRAATETASIDLAAGRAEANFEDLARALNISEDAARRLTGEVLQSQAAANRLEDSARDIARQLGLSDHEANRLAGSLREADRAADAINVTTLTLGGRFAALRTSIGTMGTALAGIGGAAVLGAALVGANNAIQSFARLTDSINAVRVVFGEASGSVLAFGEDAAASAGLSQEAFNQAVAPIGAVLTNFGFNAGEAATAASTLIQRGADLASVYGGSVNDAVLAITSALVGQVEPLRRFGGEISQARVEAFALATGLLQAGEEMDTATAVQARYGLILKDTAVVQGDFVNTSDDLANAQRIAGAELQNFVTDIGESLAPALETILGLVPDAVEGIRQFVPAFAAAGDSAAVFFQSIGEGGGFRTEGAGLAAFFDVVTAGGGIAANVGGVIAGMGRDILNLDSDATSTAAALERFNVVLEEPIARGIALKLASDLDKGEDAVTAFGRAIATTAKSTTSLDTFERSFRGLSTAANLTKEELRGQTGVLLENRVALGLTGPEVGFLRQQYGLLTAELDPNIESLRQQQYLLSQMPESFAPTVTALEGVQKAASEAGVSLGDIVTGIDPVAQKLGETLTPAQNTALAFLAIGTESGAAAAILQERLRPAIADVGGALTDLNDDGKLSRTEFITNLEAMTEAALAFRADFANVAVISPELAANIATLPNDIRNQLLASFRADPANILVAEVALLGEPSAIAESFRDTVGAALELVRRTGPNDEARTTLLAQLTDSGDFSAGELAALTQILEGALDVSFADVQPPSFTPVIVRSFEEMNQAELLASLDDALGASFADLELPTITPAMLRSIQGMDSAAIARAVQTATSGPIDRALNASFGDVELSALTPQIVESVEETNTTAVTGVMNAALGASFADVDLPSFTPIFTAAIGKISGKEVTAALDAALGVSFADVDLTEEGAVSRQSYFLGLSTPQAGEAARLRESITDTLDKAITKKSPPKLFLDAGLESAEAFWMGFEQADLALRVPVPQMTGKIQTGTAAAGSTVGGGFTFAPTYVNTETRDLETVVARSEQLMGAVSGILNGRFKL